MADLLKKEKAFHEMNEKLNRISGGGSGGKAATTSPHKQNHKKATTITMTTVTTMGPTGPTTAATTKGNEQSRVASKTGGTYTRTFTKGKGISTLLKKQGAGDYTQTYTQQRAHGHTHTHSHATASPPQRTSPTMRASTGVGAGASPTKPAHTTTKQKAFLNRELIVRYKNPNYNQFSSKDLLNETKQKQFSPPTSPPAINTRTIPMATTTATNNAGAHGEGLSNDADAIKAKGPAHNTNTFTVNKDLRLYRDKKRLTTEGLIKFLKSKIVILEEKDLALNRELAKQKELAERSYEHSKALEQQRDQVVNKNNALTDQVKRLENQLEESNVRLKEKTQIQLQLQKETEELRREVKLLTQGHNNMEKRLQRAYEEIEAGKTSMAAMKTAEREFRDSVRLESENKDRVIKNHKKMRNELLNAIRKQLYLIDNLGRQNVCLEQAACLNITEKEFNKFLESKMTE